MLHANVDGAITAVNAAKRAAVPRLVMTSSAATLGEAHGVVADEWATHRGFYLSNYEQQQDARRAVRRCGPRSEIGQDVVYVNPSSVQGPGRAGGTGKFFLAFIDGRLKVFVDTYVSLVDIQDCCAGHLLAAERGVAGERYILSGIGMTITEALTLAADVAGVERKPRLAPRPLAMVGGSAAELRVPCPRASTHRSAGRWCARCSTATVMTAPAPSVNSVWSTRRPEKPCKGPSTGPAPKVCCLLTFDVRSQAYLEANVQRPVPQRGPDGAGFS